MTARSVRIGAVAGAAMTLFYVAVVAGASGSWQHLTDQARQDWYYLVVIIAGFAAQVAMFTELRRRHRLHHPVAAASGAGAGASTAGMVACCAHHLADLVPFIGATGAAAFLTDYRLPFMLGGIGVNAVGLTIAGRRLRRTRLPDSGEDLDHRQDEACAAA